jgi:hypothetical protein
MTQRIFRVIAETDADHGLPLAATLNWAFAGTATFEVIEGDQMSDMGKITISDAQAAELLSFYPYTGPLFEHLNAAAQRWLETADRDSA